MHKGAWWAAVQGSQRSRTWLGAQTPRQVTLRCVLRRKPSLRWSYRDKCHYLATDVKGVFFFFFLVWIFVLAREPSNQTSMYFTHSFLGQVGAEALFSWEPLFSSLAAISLLEANSMKLCFVAWSIKPYFQAKSISNTSITLFKSFSQLAIVRKAQVPGLGSRIWAECLTLLISWCSTHRAWGSGFRFPLHVHVTPCSVPAPAGCLRLRLCEMILFIVWRHLVKSGRWWGCSWETCTDTWLTAIYELRCVHVDYTPFSFASWNENTRL